MRRYTYAEALADRIAGQAYAALPPAERVELVGLLTAAAAATSRRRGRLNGAASPIRSTSRPPGGQDGRRDR